MDDQSQQPMRRGTLPMRAPQKDTQMRTIDGTDGSMHGKGQTMNMTTERHVEEEEEEESGGRMSSSQDETQEMPRPDSTHNRSAAPRQMQDVEHAVAEAFDDRPSSPLIFTDLQHAEVFQDPRFPLQEIKDYDESVIYDDIDEVLNNQPIYVQKLRSAYRNFRLDEVPHTALNEDGMPYDASLSLRWREWQVLHWSRLQRVENSSEDYQKIIEARLWAVVKEAIAVHRFGSIEGVAPDQDYTCSERLTAVGNILNSFTIVRADIARATLNKVNIPLLVAAPSSYAGFKRDLFRQWLQMNPQGSGQLPLAQQRAEDEAQARSNGVIVIPQDSTAEADESQRQALQEQDPGSNAIPTKAKSISCPSERSAPPLAESRAIGREDQLVLPTADRPSSQVNELPAGDINTTQSQNARDAGQDSSFNELSNEESDEWEDRDGEGDDDAGTANHHTTQHSSAVQHIPAWHSCIAPPSRQPSATDLSSPANQGRSRQWAKGQKKRATKRLAKAGLLTPNG